MAGSEVVGLLKVLLQADTAQFEAKLKTADQNTAKLADRLQRDLVPSQKAVNAAVRDFLGTQEIAKAETFAKAVEHIGGASKLLAADQIKVNKAVTDALAVYRQLGQAAPAHLMKLAAETTQFKTTTQAAFKEAEAGATKFNTALSTMKGVLGALGVQVGIGAVVNFGARIFEAADNVGDLAVKMGVSTEAAQRFQWAARQSGAEIDDISRSIVKMNDNLAEGDKSTVAALEAAGLRFADIRAMKPEDAFRTIADAIGEMPDPLLQTQVAMDLFGKSGAEILTMIREKSLEAADGIAVWSDDTLQALKDAKQAWENFGNSVVMLSGTVLARLTNIRDLFRLIASGGNFAMVNAMAEAESIAKAEQKRLAAMSPAERQAAFSSFNLGSDVQEVGAGSIFDLPNRPKAFKTKAQIEAEKKAAEDSAAAAKKAGDAAKDAEAKYQAWKRATLGLSDAQRQLLGYETRLIKEGHLAQVAALLKVESSTEIATKGMANYAGAIRETGNEYEELSRRMQAMSGLVNKTSTAELLKGGIAGKDIFTGQPGSLFGNIAGQLPQTIMAALTGGGNVGGAIGGLLGGQLLGQFSGTVGKALSGVLGKTLGGAMGSILPGLGTLLGSMIGPLFDKLASIGQNTTKKSRDQFATGLGFGSLDALYKQLQGMGAAGAALANTGLNVIGKKDDAANAKWMKDVQAFLTSVPAKLDALRASLSAFGGAIPKSLGPMVADLLKLEGLSPDLRKQLDGMAKGPSWQTAQSLAGQFGVSMGALGGGFNQSRLADSAFTLSRAIDTFLTFEGADQKAILEGMADEFSVVAADAIRSGAALPKSIESYVRQISAMGLLLDDTGTAIDTAALTFKDMEDEALKEVVSILGEIRDLLAGRTTAGSGGGDVPTGDSFWKKEMPRIVDDPFWAGLTEPGLQLPGFAGGTHGQFMDFGAGTPVMLHGKEAVVPESDAAFGSSGTMTVQLIQDGRMTAKAIVPWLPGQTKRYAVGR